MRQITFKEIMFSFLYLIYAIIVYSILYGMTLWLIESVVYDILNWFNERNVFLKLFLLFIGATVILTLVFNLAGIIVSAFSAINLLFPVNLFTNIVSRILALINIILSTIVIYKTIPFWDFWFVIEFIILILFVISINRILIPRKLKMFDDEI